MRVHTLHREQWIPRPPGEVFDFFADARNLGLITPPSLSFRMLGEPDDPPREGTVIRYRLRLRGIPVRWTARIERWDPPHRFVDRQLRGPYRHWQHTHEFEPEGEGTLVRDVIGYAMRAGPLGELARRAYVAGELERIFDYRLRRLAEIFGSAGTGTVGSSG